MLRVGSVPYWVGRPLDLGLGDEPGVSLSFDVPARLVEGLRSGRLDVALVSSIELFRQPGYRYLDGPVVAGEEGVSSVQVFLRRPVEAVASLALDPSSRTAAALTRVVWPTRPQPAYVEVPAGEDPRAARADAWLRIGNPALEERWLSAADHATFDPAAAWKRDTGLPFVFATWTVRPGFEVEPWTELFLRSQRRGLERLEEIVQLAARESGLPRARLQEYLSHECCFDLRGRARASLELFRDRAAPLELCRADLQPEPVPARSPRAEQPALPSCPSSAHSSPNTT
jgi:chorismate dehydratase